MKLFNLRKKVPDETVHPSDTDPAPVSQSLSDEKLGEVTGGANMDYIKGHIRNDKFPDE